MKLKQDMPIFFNVVSMCKTYHVGYITEVMRVMLSMQENCAEVEQIAQ
jgi:hypothetical protein